LAEAAVKGFRIKKQIQQEIHLFLPASLMSTIAPLQLATVARIASIVIGGLP
jgi:hypothetical protein